MSSSIPLKCCSRKEKCVHPDGPWLPNTKEYFYIEHHILAACCKKCAYQRARKYIERNQEAVKEYHHQYYLSHKKEFREAFRRTYHRNPEAHKIRRQRYAQTEKGKSADKRSIHKRLARKRNLPDQFTRSEWSFCLDYWNDCCAYCGNSRGFWNKITLEHFIPLCDPSSPGTVARNILPACEQCNYSKQDKKPEEWLHEKFGKSQSKRILQRIEAYFYLCLDRQE